MKGFDYAGFLIFFRVVFGSLAFDLSFVVLLLTVNVQKNRRMNEFLAFLFIFRLLNIVLSIITLSSHMFKSARFSQPG